MFTLFHRVLAEIKGQVERWIGYDTKPMFAVLQKVMTLRAEIRPASLQPEFPHSFDQPEIASGPVPTPDHQSG